MKQTRLARLATLASGTAVIALAGCNNNNGSNVKTAPTGEGTEPVHINAPPNPTKVPPAEAAEAGALDVPKVNAPPTVVRPPHVNAPPGNP